MSELDPRQMVLGDLEQELAHTRELHSRIPDEHLDWKAHDRSMKIGDTAIHLVRLLKWGMSSLDDDGFDMAVKLPDPPTIKATKDLLAFWDEEVALLRASVARADVASLAGDWSLRHGPMVFFTQPKHQVFRVYVVSHMIHHRAQLGVYLRMQDVPLPPIYGPTADEAPPMPGGDPA